MPYLPSYLGYALSSDEITHKENEVDYIFRRRKLGDLAVPSGKIVACDPLVCPDSGPYSRQLPTGNFPVHVSIAHVRTDQRVAFASIEFSARPIEKWEMAVMPGQDTTKLKADGYYGYPVDAGLGCFMDEIVARKFNQRMSDESEYADEIITELNKTQINTWSWANVMLAEPPPANVIIFSSGWGDGMYGSYFGLDADGGAVCLVTDFGLIFEQPSERSESSSPTKSPSRWQFWRK